ncbi:hypothetical protein MYA98_08020 [Salmonella sp. WGH-01]|nr:hypothetical protein MYA98_08020 [Salmonella sp. WGH-01]
MLDVTNLTDRPQTLNIALAASGLLELLSQQPQPVNWRRACAPPYSFRYARWKVLAKAKSGRPLAV